LVSGAPGLSGRECRLIAERAKVRSPGPEQVWIQSSRGGPSLCPSDDSRHATTPISTAEREHLRSDHAKALVDFMPIDLHVAILDAVVLCGGGFLVIGALTPESGFTSAQVRHKLAVKPS
jgi:hypothetical protein